MEQLTLITEIKPLIPARLAGEQHQRLPFSQGQLLQGVIIAKADAHQFTLEINGQKITAESSAQLQVGQKLDLQVTSMTPQIELQIVSGTPVNRWLGNVLPLLSHQSLLMPEVTALAGDSHVMSQLSTTTQETLQFYSGNMGRVGLADTLQSSSTTVQLLDLITQTATIPPGQKLEANYQQISELLLQLTRAPSIPPGTAAQAARFAELFAQMAGQKGPPVLSLSSAGLVSPITAEEKTEALLTLLGRMAQNNPANTNTFSQLLPLVQENTALPSTHPIRQLLSFLLQSGSELHPPQYQRGTEPQTEEYLNRLGIAMERLLAENKPEEAARTLKFALLELSQQAGSADKSTVAPDQLTKTLELYQLLQIRLASEALFFLPLPFSFLQQGYLLVDSDRSGGESKTEGDLSSRTDQTIELHLQLEGLGNVQIDIRRQEDRVALKFLTENAEKAKFVAGFREELEQWITSTNLDSVQFLVGANEPVRTLLEIITRGGTGMIDTRA